MAVTFVETMFLPIFLTERFVQFDESVTAVGIERLTQVFAAAVSRNELAIDDLELAAHQFAELCRADLFYKCLFCVKISITKAEIDRVADGAVATFLQAFGNGLSQQA
jgi:TetR/AcrR family transcriptional regulator, mexJK operon transcriptional repressor